jgi:hypothetical protein
LFAVVLAPPVELFGFMFIVLAPLCAVDDPALFACCDVPMLHGEFCVAPVLRPEFVPVPVPSVDAVPDPLLDEPALDPPPPDWANAMPPLTAKLSAAAAAKRLRLFMKDSLAMLSAANSGYGKGLPAKTKRCAPAFLCRATRSQ